MPAKTNPGLGAVVAVEGEVVQLQLVPLVPDDQFMVMNPYSNSKKDPSFLLLPVDVIQHLLEDLQEAGELVQAQGGVHGLREEQGHDPSGHEAHGQAVLPVADHPLVDV